MYFSNLTLAKSIVLNLPRYQYKKQSMGIVYSLNSILEKHSDIAVNGANEELLRSSSAHAQSLVACYLKYQYPPMVDNINLHSYFMNVEKNGQVSSSHASQVALLWKIYEVQSICYIQEVISCLVLLSEASWHQRLTLLFDIFKCSGNDEMMYDDVVLASQVIAMSLYRLWGDQSWDQVEWCRLTESIADAAFSKLEKDLESGITREEFVNWAMERFKESRSVSSGEALMRLFNSYFD